MEDKNIIDLYWAREESAIKHTAAKYGSYCYAVAWNILYNQQDTEECVNDTYLRVWNAIPPHRPNVLQTFLGKITRNLSLDRWRRNNSENRGCGSVAAVLDELEECVPGSQGDITDDLVIRDALNAFLASLSPVNRRIFMRRYWYLSSVREIAEDFGLGESKVKMILLRSRLMLKTKLEKEGISL